MTAFVPTIPLHEPTVSFVLLRVQTRFPIPGGAGAEAVRRLWSHDAVTGRVELIAEGETLHDVVAQLHEPPKAAP